MQSCCCNSCSIRGWSCIMSGATILIGYSSRTSPTVSQVEMVSLPSKLLKPPALCLWRESITSIIRILKTVIALIKQLHMPNQSVSNFYFHNEEMYGIYFKLYFGLEELAPIGCTSVLSHAVTINESLTATLEIKLYLSSQSNF